MQHGTILCILDTNESLEGTTFHENVIHFLKYGPLPRALKFGPGKIRIE